MLGYYVFDVINKTNLNNSVLQLKSYLLFNSLNNIIKNNIMS